MLDGCAGTGLKKVPSLQQADEATDENRGLKDNPAHVAIADDLV